jgi:hypothetical protein
MVQLSPQTQVCLTLTAAGVHTILTALGEILHKEAAPLEAEIMLQLEKQFAPKPQIEPSPAPEAK